VDEADFVEDAIYKQAVVPIARKSPNAILMISTDGKNEDSFMQLVKHMNKETGRMVRFGAKCPVCSRDPFYKKDDCNHIHAYMPTTYNAAREAKIKEIYAMTGGAEDYKKEILGINTNNPRNIYKDSDVAYVFERGYERRALSRPFYISVGADPAQGGANDFAFVATARDANDKHCWVCTPPRPVGLFIRKKERKTFVLIWTFFLGLIPIGRLGLLSKLS